jgi:hypothetical protein
MRGRIYVAICVAWFIVIASVTLARIFYMADFSFSCRASGGIPTRGVFDLECIQR